MMKKKLFFLFVVFLLVANGSQLSSYTWADAPKADVTFTIKNDTGGSFRIYDEKGYYTIVNGSTKKVTVEVGRKFYNGEGGKKGDLLFEAEASFEGKTLKISDYL